MAIQNKLLKLRLEFWSSPKVKLAVLHGMVEAEMRRYLIAMFDNEFGYEHPPITTNGAKAIILKGTQDRKLFDWRPCAFHLIHNVSELGWQRWWMH